MNFFIGYCCAIAAILAWIVFGLRRLKRDMPIDMARLTEDLQPSQGAVESATVRYTVDPKKLSNDEIRAIHRVRAQDYRDAAEIRERMRWGQ